MSNQEIPPECEKLLEDRAYAVYRRLKGKEDKEIWSEEITKIDTELREKKCELPLADTYTIRIGMENPPPRMVRMKIYAYNEKMASRLASEIALDYYFDPDYGIFSEVEEPEVTEKIVAKSKKTKRERAILRKREQELERIIEHLSGIEKQRPLTDEEQREYSKAMSENNEIFKELYFETVYRYK
jgi:hypothetical protein